jgi:hypothetical protein
LGSSNILELTIIIRLSSVRITGYPKLSVRIIHLYESCSHIIIMEAKKIAIATYKFSLRYL